MQVNLSKYENTNTSVIFCANINRKYVYEIQGGAIINERVERIRA